MYTRGQFAIIGKTTVKALRIYEEMGLLKPDHVESSNQYKYYSPVQVDEIIFINELKAFGFSLDEIKDIKRENNQEYMAECFLKRLAQLDLEINDAKGIKERLRKKISEIRDNEILKDNEQKYVIELVEMDKIIVASCRERINIQDAGRLVGRVYEQIQSSSLEAVDSHMIIFHDTDPQINDWDVEVCVPVNRDVKCEDFSTRIIDKNTYARTLHTGSFSRVGKAHAAVIDWTKANGYDITGSPIEKYLSKQVIFNPSSMEIEIYYPVSKA